MRVQSTLEASTLTGVSSSRKILGALAPAHGDGSSHHSVQFRQIRCSIVRSNEHGSLGLQSPQDLFRLPRDKPSISCCYPPSGRSPSGREQGFRPRAAQCRACSSSRLHRGLRTLPRRACHHTRQLRRRDRRLHRYLRRPTLQLRRRRLHRHDHRPCAHHLTSRRPRRRLCQVLHLCRPSSRRPRRRRHFLLPRRLRGSPTLAT